jgi:D-glycero-beta-D-manno-heptose-7-phosphate kinase
MNKEGRYKKIFNDFNGLNVLVIGDVMVDSYLWGKVERISPEAPIPIVTLKTRENRMGGAANVAMNLKALGARPILCSVIGNDEKGDRFIELLEEEEISTHGIHRSDKRITTTKFRIFGNNMQMLRVDEEVENDLASEDYNSLLGLIKRILQEEKISCIIFQDYDKGVISKELISEVVEMSGEQNIPTTVDPKRRNFKDYKGVTLFKPNLKELKEGLRIEFDNHDREAVIAAAHQLRDLLNCNYILTTLSEQGVLISLNDRLDQKDIFIPAHLRSVSDVSGAGDTVISVASLCLALGCSPYEIAYISNLAGGLVCEEVGVVPVNKEKLLKEVQSLLHEHDS